MTQPFLNPSAAVQTGNFFIPDDIDGVPVTPEYFALILARFERMHIPEPMSGCLIWTGCWTSSRYGILYINKIARVAHRAAWCMFNGPIPAGLDLDHKCRTRPCVNVTHLEPVTHRVNILRGEGPCAVNARKTICGKGHPLDESNTYVYSKTGGRYCKQCQRNTSAQRYRDSKSKFLPILPGSV